MEDYEHIRKPMEAAAKRAVPVRVLLAAPDNGFLASSNDEALFSGMRGLIESTLYHLNWISAREL
jgi:hypothetical protein